MVELLPAAIMTSMKLNTQVAHFECYSNIFDNRGLPEPILDTPADLEELILTYSLKYQSLLRVYTDPVIASIVEPKSWLTISSIHIHQMRGSGFIMLLVNDAEWLPVCKFHLNLKSKTPPIGVIL